MQNQNSYIRLPPRSIPSKALFSISVIALISVVVFAYTGVGVDLIAGVPWGFKLVDFMPVSLQLAVFLFCLLIGLFGLRLAISDRSER